MFKLRYHLQAMQKQAMSAMVTLGGAHSNHLAAAAQVCFEQGFQFTAIVRGEKPLKLSPTLERIEAIGGKLQFVDRATYRALAASRDDRLPAYPNHYYIPEGGAGDNGIKGAAEMLEPEDSEFSHIVVAVGTGTTFAGICSAALPHQCVVGVVIHRHERVAKQLAEQSEIFTSEMLAKHRICHDFHFGGYVKYTPELLDFTRRFWKAYRIALDPIYTAKAAFAIEALAARGELKSSDKVLLLHTGGLQAVPAFEEMAGVSLYPEVE